MCSLGLSQVGRINLGQNVSSLRYFTICGLQEGFEPFAINMKRDITMWFSKSLPQFITVPTDHPHIEVLLQRFLAIFPNISLPRENPHPDALSPDLPC